MGSNSFGTLLRITTWGESHGTAIGVVVDGCPAGLPLSIEEVQSDLDRRRPGYLPYTSPRRESDRAEILSGIFEGHTTGAPIAIAIANQDGNSSAYEPIKHILRPGHAPFTYLQKYGIFDHRGGGRASARETAARVAAGSIAKKLLRSVDIEIIAYIRSIGHITATNIPTEKDALIEATRKSPLFCPDVQGGAEMEKQLRAIKEEGDTLGGVVEAVAFSLPPGLGDPVYEKLEAKLAHAMLSLPASKGFEIGAGFAAAQMRGSEHNDLFVQDVRGTTTCPTNHAGGTLGGISTGMPLLFRVAFKPPSSINKPQASITTCGQSALLELPAGSRHDPCVAIRAVPVVEAMTALVLADALLLHRSARLDFSPLLH